MISFSIITVVYNDILHIVETMESVVEQSYKQIEYILIDGASTDGTKEKIAEYISLCADITLKTPGDNRYYLEATHKKYSTITFKFLSEKDNGIYDAMNKGVALATKIWVNFMNCGDKFYSPIVLDRIIKKDIDKYDVIYGDTQIMDNNTTFISISSKNIKNRIPFCHQSSFVKTHILTSTPFDTSYKICADNNFFIELYHANYRFKKLDFPISTYLLDGLSSSLSWRIFYEYCKTGSRYNKLFPFYLACKWILWTIPHKIFINVLKKKNA